MCSYSVLVLQLFYWELAPLKPTQREPAPSPSLCPNYNIIFGLNMQELKICSVFQATSMQLQYTEQERCRQIVFPKQILLFKAWKYSSKINFNCFRLVLLKTTSKLNLMKLKRWPKGTNGNCIVKDTRI